MSLIELPNLNPAWGGGGAAPREPVDGHERPLIEAPNLNGAIFEALEPLLRPVLEMRDRVGQLGERVQSWPADFHIQMNLWLEDAVTYVGDRWWQAVRQEGERLLREVTTTNDFTRILTEIPAAWTWQNPVVWALWATMTGCFLAFLAPQLALLLATASHKRRQGAPWGDLFDDGFQLLLGIGAALLSPVGAVLLLLVVNIMAGLIVQGSTVLPGLPPASEPDEAGRNALLLLVYGITCVLLLMERVAAVAVVMLCLVLSGWGLGSYFWPRMGNWWRVWRTLMTAALGSMLLQNILFRLGGETINRVLQDAPSDTREGNFLGLVLGLTCVILCVLAPALLGGGYAAGAVVRLVSRVARPAVRATGRLK